MSDRPSSSGPSPSPATVEYLICGSPTDAFYSQIAFFRLSLDAFGDEGRASRVVAVFGDDQIRDLPPRWQPHFANIEVHHAPPEEYRRTEFYAASDLRFRLVDPGADVSILCDADTVLLRALPREFLDRMTCDPAIAAVMAHYPFRVVTDTRAEHGRLGLHPGLSVEERWRALGVHVLGRELDLQYQHSLRGMGPSRAFRGLPPGSLARRVRTALSIAWQAQFRRREHIGCPFYPNYGFIAGSPALLSALADELDELHPVVERYVQSPFYGQVAIALAMQRAELPARQLPMRFNFPNLAVADKELPGELARIVLLHYLSQRHFDRHRVFSDRETFERMLSLELTGSNAAFQRHVAHVTNGDYPFA